MRVLKELGKLGAEGIAALDSVENLCAGELAPVGGDDSCNGVMLAQKRDSRLKLFLADILTAAQNDAGGIFNLIVEKFAEVFDVHTALSRVRDGGKTV